MSITNQVALPKIAQERMKRMETRTAKVGVIGLGYVGLPLSLLLSEAGFKVTGFDIDAKKVADLEAGRSYIFRIPAEEIQSAVKKGSRLRLTFPVYRSRTPLLCACRLR
jgi:UDP-N-acetyl-D-glucosamine dehydrogenase